MSIASAGCPGIARQAKGAVMVVAVAAVAKVAEKVNAAVATLMSIRQATGSARSNHP